MSETHAAAVAPPDRHASGSRVEIRDAAFEDAAWVATLWRGALSGAWSRREIERAISGDRASVWLANDAARASSAGFLVAEDQGGRFEVHALVVARHSRRRGVGAGLLERALAEASSRGCRCVDLEVASGNTEGLALYRAHEFVAVGRRPRYYRGGEDAVLMTRELTDGR